MNLELEESYPVSSLKGRFPGKPGKWSTIVVETDETKLIHRRRRTTLVKFLITLVVLFFFLTCALVVLLVKYSTMIYVQ